MENNLISIIMPAYNTSKYIYKSIQSVLNQTYKNFELIIIEDKSTDNTKQIINTFNDKRITLIENISNLGVGPSRNVGILRSKGKFVAFLDSDDIWEIDKLSIQLKFMISNNYSFTFHPLIFINKDDILIGKPKLKEIKVNFRFLLRNTIIPTSSIMIDKVFFKDILFPISKYSSGEDYAFCLNLLKQTNFAYGIKEFLGYYRKTNTSLSSRRYRNIIKVFYVQNSLFKVSIMEASINSIFYCFNAIIKHYFFNKI
jgi:teichuronic acid biosynthesis glycosyltransferase TuaG